jgi:hypothetical protein
MRLNRIHARVVLTSVIFSCLLVLASASAQEHNENAPAQQPAANAAQQQVPSIDGGLGPCSVEVIVKRPGGKVVDGAKVTVHIAYGFLNVRRLDLEVPTNTQGKARITGLPNNLKHGLLLHGSKDNLLGTAFVDPAKNCEAKHELVLVQQAPPPDQDNSQPAAEQSDQKDTGNKDAGSKDAGEKDTGTKDTNQSKDTPQ